MRVITGDVTETLYRLEPASVDVIFADPPYFLSGPGASCKGGRRVVDKGAWDRPRTRAQQYAFGCQWIGAARRALRPTGSLWICGTSHSLPSAALAADDCGLELINEVTWEKPNPPPNLGCRCLTHSTERLLWLRPAGGAHYFAYDEMREENGGKQLKDVWRFTAPSGAERARGGGHTCQKPVALVKRALRASCPARGRVVDLFCGSGTASEAAAVLELEVVAVDGDPAWTAHTLGRLAEIRRRQAGGSHAVDL